MSIPLEIDYYAILEIHEEADPHEVKRAFRRLSLLRHPDKNPNNPDAHAAFCTLNEAYDTLKDASRRILYNAKYPSIKSKWKDFYGSQEQERANQESWKAKVERLRKECKEREEREEVKKKRAEEERWEGERIAHIREELARVETQINAIKEAGRERVRLEKNEKGWWGYMTTGWGRKTEDIEEEKIKRDQEKLQKLASERIKIELLEGQRKKLQQDEKIQLRIIQESELRDRVRRERDTRAQEAKEAAERKRAAEERQSQEEERRRKQRETKAQEAREAAERKRAAEQREAQEQERKRKQWEAWAKAFQEKETADNIAREKAKERTAAARAAAEKEREAREALLKKVREAQAQAELAKGWKQHATENTPKDNKTFPQKGRSTRQRDPASQTRARQSAENPTSGQGAQDSYMNTRHGVCLHSGFWPKIQGKNRCAVCSQDFYSFILQCPTCSMMACASCKKQLRVGRKGKSS